MNMKYWLVAVMIPIASFVACGDDGGDSSGATTTQNPQPSQGGGGAATTGAGAMGGMGGMGPECPYEGPPKFDVSTLPSCPSYLCGEGAHCVPKGLVPAEFASQLADCNKDLYCVPDPLIETNGDYIPPTCVAVLGLEGRCLSDCLPQVKDQAALLEQATCNSGELCVPCFDPLTTLPTGACVLSCDPGPTDPPPAELPTCCGGDDGTCVPKEVVPDDQEGSLAQDKCPDADSLCVPNELLDPNFNGIPCAPALELQLLGIEDGACLPECVDAVKNIGAGSCPAGYKCGPCDVFGEPTGACDDDW